MKNISYSAWSKFLLCPRMYDIYYNERLQPSATTSALVFGTALDEALNRLYLDKADPVKTFQDNFEYHDMSNVVFHKRDLNRSVFTEDQLKKLKGKDDHYISWAVLRIRGRVLLEHYVETFYKKVTKVFDVQSALTSGRRGYLDLKACVEMEGKTKIIIDHKTSYYEYDDDAANFGAQLILYAKEEKIDTVAYCVLLKDVRTLKVKTCKTCNFVVQGGSHKTCNSEVDGVRCNGEWTFTVGYDPKIQWIVGKPSNHMKDTMTASVKMVENLIEQCDKDKVYPSNYATCNFVFGRQCEYYDYCHKKDKSDLVEREKK